MSRLLATILLGLLLLSCHAPQPSHAQTLPGIPATAPEAGEPAREPPSPEEIRQLTALLQDPGQREELIRRLELLAAAAEPPQEVERPSEAIGSQLVDAISEQVGGLRDELWIVGWTMAGLTQAGDWIEEQFRDRQRLRNGAILGGELAFAIALGFGAGWAARRLLSGLRRSMSSRIPAGLMGRAGVLAARTLLDLIPILAFAAAGYGALALLDPPRTSRLAALAILNGGIVYQMLVTVSRAILTPASPNLRLVSIGDGAAREIYKWGRRIGGVLIYGYSATATADLLGLPPSAQSAVLKLLWLVVGVLAVVAILRNRRRVGEWIAGSGSASGQTDEAGLQTSLYSLALARQRFGRIWHILAIGYVAAMYAVYFLEIPDGAWLVRRAVYGTLAILVALVVLQGILERTRDKLAGSAEGAAPAGRMPGRVASLLQVLQLAVGILAVGLILMAWGVDIPGWLASPAGERIAGSAATIALIIGIAYVVWEFASGAIERRLARSDRQGKSIEPSARVRTLLPLLRSTLLISIITVAGLTILAEIGVDVTPLLAGAGVFGLAIGFGSQALVKDLITGLFFLLEDAMSVGDVVNVSGKGGLVEAISIRSLRLRDLDGTVHTIPFGSVTMLSNMTKGFSHYVFDVRVSFREDTDRIIAVMRELDEELRSDPDFKHLILEPLEVLGVDGFLENAVLVKARIKTRPIQQWNVGREFNRRLKKRFDSMGIEIPLPQLKLHTPQEQLSDQGAEPDRARLRVPGQV
ncbi:mechanosensitive ion channel domain-containing protein [Indioceanicola profundi]|uniref:mechanosensitive ion channel domain-containing protein n=1 Tax=Indioceanicola profundi TaxID=2220096 RepID=UPI000E6AC971|nr:mechanosensitive ion channel domain-containing protein [Indioceanicola profundi]